MDGSLDFNHEVALCIMSKCWNIFCTLFLFMSFNYWMMRSEIFKTQNLSEFDRNLYFYENFQFRSIWAQNIGNRFINLLCRPYFRCSDKTYICWILMHFRSRNYFYFSKILKPKLITQPNSTQTFISFTVSVISLSR